MVGGDGLTQSTFKSPNGAYLQTGSINGQPVYASGLLDGEYWVIYWTNDFGGRWILIDSAYPDNDGGVHLGNDGGRFTNATGPLGLYANDGSYTGTPEVVP